MNLIELNGALRQLRLSGMAGTLETRLLQAQSDAMAPIDLISILVSDELSCRSERLLERRHKQACFRDTNKTLDTFDFQFNPKMNRALVFDLATAAFIGRREDGLFIGPPGSGKSHLAQAIGHAVILQGYRVLYREAHVLLEDLADATLDGKRKEHMEMLSTVPLLIIDDLGMRKLPLTAAEELLEIIMRRYERTSTLLDVEQTRGGLGQAARRQCRRHRHAGPPATSRTRSQVRATKLANQNREARRGPMTKARTIRRPGKSSPATSRFVIQGPLQRSTTKRMATETQNPSQSQPSRPTCKGSQSPIPSEPAPRLRPWMSPPGATPAGTALT